MSASRVNVAGRSWESSEPGFFCFEATVDGEPTVLHVSEEVAFDLLHAWTVDRAKCLDVLRLNRAALARMLEATLKSSRRLHTNVCHRLTWRNTNPAALAEVRVPAHPDFAPISMGAQ